jgi:putative transcriptional regulator
VRQEMFDELLEAVRQGGQYIRGRRAPSRTFELKMPDVKAIREKHDLSQNEFASLLRIPPATLRNWEQGRRQPEGPARVLLQIAAQNFDAVLLALHRSSIRVKKGGIRAAKGVSASGSIASRGRRPAQKHRTLR